MEIGIERILPFKSKCLTKRCSRCGEVKSREEFNKDRGRERPNCKVCHRMASKEFASANRGMVREYHRGWIKNNKDKVRAYAKKAYDKRSPEQKAKKSAYNKRRNLERKYGLSQDDWDRMLASQGGLCALCRIPGRLGKHGKLAVDHCHETGVVRGLLCTPCNISLGILGETRGQISRVLDYVTNGWRPDGQDH